MSEQMDILEMSNRMTDEELAELGWSRCSNCGAIRSPYTGLDFHNHATEDCIYSHQEGWIIDTPAAQQEQEDH